MRRHERNERLAEVSGDVLEHEAIVTVHDNEQRSPGERVQVSGVQAVCFFLLLVFGVSFAAGQHAAKVIAHWKMI